MTHPLGVTPDGIEICVDLIKSEASSNIARQPQLIGFAKEMLAGKRLTGEEVRLEQDMGREVGYDTVVPTQSDDAVFYAQILRDTTYTRFIKSNKAFSTSYVAVILRRSEDGKTYELQDVRVGRLVPPRPGAPDETPESKEYWSSHAVAYEGQILQPRSITKECPW